MTLSPDGGCILGLSLTEFLRKYCLGEEPALHLPGIGPQEVTSL